MNETVIYSVKRKQIPYSKGDDAALPQFNITTGLSDLDAEKSRKIYGKNVFTEKKRRGFIQTFLSNLNDPIIRILIGALLVNIIFMFTDINWYETAGIALTIFISAFVSTVSEYSSGTAFEKLHNQLGDAEYSVIRGGSNRTLPICDIVRYDVVLLRSGDIVPADGIILRGDCTVDESPLTGESRSVKKACDFSICEKIRKKTFDFDEKLSVSDSFVLLRGSAVSAGEVTLLVSNVGDHTYYGAVAAELQDSEVPSPLKARLTQLARTISKIGYVSAAVIALIHLFDAFFLDSGMNLTVTAERLKDMRFVASECLAALTMAISVVVVAVPEGLPMMITVVLSSNMKKMMKSNVLVKRLVGIETAGSLSILFTDKTGTLTTGNLKVSEIYTADTTYSSLLDLKRRPSDYELILNGARLCSSNHGGNSTEKAIFRFLQMKMSSRSDYVEKIPFDSSRKYSAAVSEDGYFIIRGAPEYLLPRCRKYIASSGDDYFMTDSIRQAIIDKTTTSAQKSCRIIMQATGVARDFQKLKREGLSAIDLTFHSLIILDDEIRKNVPEAVSECKKAGMQVVMMTGDNELTAAAIGIKTGILSPNYSIFNFQKGIASYIEKADDLVITGKLIAALSDEEILRLLPCIAVVSRVTPTDKSRLVKLAQRAGHVVGMTGDGINDAPALKAADVGFAMGSGTDVSKEAGDIVITDDNFVSISKAILFGRTIFESIRKFIVFQLTMNFSAVGISLLGPLFGVDHPVTVVQLLWINIIMDTLGSLAFAGEAALPEYMRHAPIKRSEPILNSAMVRQIIYSGIYTIGLCMFFLISPGIHAIFGRGDDVYFLTVFFALFIFCGICSAFNARTPRMNIFANLGKNKAFLIIMPAVAVIQLLIIYFGGEAFRTVPLELNELFLTAAFSITIIPADMLRKLFSKRF